jgi:hypothetical protein
MRRTVSGQSLLERDRVEPSGPAVRGGMVSMPRAAARWIAPLVLALLPLVFFWPITVGGRVVYWGTPLLQFYPWRSLAVAALRAGELPLWNPWSDFGAPLAANLQTAVFSPLNVIYLVLPVETAMGWTIVIHVALAGVFMFWCGRTLGLSTWGACIAAVAFMFSGFLISRAGFLSMVAAGPWFPAIVAATHLALHAETSGRGHLRAVLLLAACTGLMLVAGHIQLAFYALIAAGGYTLTTTWQLTRDRQKLGSARRARWLLVGRIPLLATLGVALGCGLAAIQLLPTAELTGYSARSDGPGYDYAMNYSLYPFQIAQVIVPDLLGSPVTGDYRGPGNYWEGTSYLGALTLLLALIGARFGRNPARGFLLALTLVAWLFALGRFTPVYPWVFDHVPGFGLFQAPARFLFWWTFAGALLAGMGIDVLIQRGNDPGLRRWKTLPMAAAGGIGAGAVAALLVVGPAGVAGSSLVALAKAALLLIAGSGLLLFAPKLGTRWPVAAAVLVVADLFSFGAGLNPTTSPDLYRHAIPIAEPPGGQLAPRIYVRNDDFERRFGATFGFKSFGSSSADDLLPLRSTLYPNLGATAGTADAFNYDPLKLERSRRLRLIADTVPDPTPYWQLMGVGTVFDAEGSAHAVERPLLPPAFFASTTVAAGSRDEAERLVRTVDVTRTAVVEAPTVALSALGTSPATAGQSRVEATTFRQGMIATIETAGETAGLLVVTESWYPGWVARLDGVVAPVSPADLAFRAIVVPPGSHHIEFSYEPASVLIGLWISGSSVVVMAAGGAWLLMRNSRQAADA